MTPPSLASATPVVLGGRRPLSPAQVRRYSRHLLLPEIGAEGQRKLDDARVAVVGVGGLGSPAALYLAAAGVGHLGLIDADTVALSNLQRQILFATGEIGEPKTTAARRRLAALNPEIELTEHSVALTSANAREILGAYDVILDGSDNFPTRYLVNDAAALLGRPEIYGSVYRFEGQATVFDAARGPCYRCLFPEPPPPDAVPSCAEGGVLGVLPGLVGTLQALEAIKLITGVGTPLVGRLLLVDGASAQFRELTLRKDPDCAVCGPRATLRELIDYPRFCGVTESEAADPHAISPEDLRAALARSDPPTLVDVRTPAEYAVYHMPGALSVPVVDLAERAAELSRASELVLYCSVGARSARATGTLHDLGFSRVRHLRGGLSAWAAEIDPSVAF